jgi:hypothetical protein
VVTGDRAGPARPPRAPGARAGTGAGPRRGDAASGACAVDGGSVGAHGQSPAGGHSRAGDARAVRAGPGAGCAAPGSGCAAPGAAGADREARAGAGVAGHGADVRLHRPVDVRHRGVRPLPAARSARVGAACLAVIAAALAGAAIGALMDRPSAPRPSPVPLASDSTSPATSSSSVRARLRTAVGHLDGVRRPMRDRLARASTPADRASAADAIAAAYRDANRLLAPLRTRQAVRSAPAVALLARLWRDYEALARGARANEAAAFATTAASIVRRERALGAALSRWRVIA